MKNFKSSVFSRNTSLLKMASKIVVNEIKERVLENDKAQQIQRKILLAKQMTEQMGNLKGAAMKLGQMLSLDANDYLPTEVTEIFGALQKDATSIDFEVIEQQLKNELKDKFELFQIESTPLAVASIGQVHRAQYQNDQLVFKVQFPGIEKTIESDVKLLRIIFSQASILMGKSVNLESTFNELQTTLLEETDYHREGEKLIKARSFFALDDRFSIPHWFREYSTRRVLALEFKEGKAISEWLKTHPAQPEKQRIGTALFEFFLEEFFKLGMVQTDPNPGNFLINTLGQIVILDFGAAKEYNEEFISSYKEILRAGYKKDKDRVIELSTQFGLLNAKESTEVFDLYYEMMDLMIAPFRSPEKFNLADRDYFQNAQEYGLNLSKKCRYSPPPDKIIFLHRKIGGIFQLLRKMEVELNLNDYWNRYIA